MAYNFTAQWLKGANNQAADPLSRHPHSPPNHGDDLAEYEIDTKNGQAITSQALSIAQLRLSRVNQEEQENLLRRHAKEDPVYQNLKEVIVNGFPSQKSSLPDHLKSFWSVKDNLSVEEDFVVYGCRLLIPTSLHTQPSPRCASRNLAVPGQSSTGQASIGTSRISFKAAVTVKTTYRPTPKNP